MENIIQTTEMDSEDPFSYTNSQTEIHQSLEDIITKINPKMLTKTIQLYKYRLKRDTTINNSSFYSKITSFVKENLQCNTMIARICPGSHIGCAICRYYTKESCSGVCTAQDIICNAALISCISEKK